jgi:sphingomyelin phosphodiesterase 2
MALKLKVLTLNCWGVFMPFSCQHKNERISAIASELFKGEYDIAILQEIWTQGDYNKLCVKLHQVMPNSHYFHSGMFGSGVCIFSKHVICETVHHRFTLNGHPHKLFQSDWYCGKSVGLAQIQIKDVRINVYSAHLHAQYHEEDDNEAHRAVQSFEMSQFIKHTSDGCDLVIVGGDFNYRPDQLGYRVIRYCSNLDDCWIARREKANSDSEEMTCDRPDNPYTSPHSLKFRPNGTRLDYIMFRPNAGMDITCEKCYLTMQQVPDTPYHFSDHEGVAAIFTIRRNLTAMGKHRESGEIEKHLSDTLLVIDKGVKKAKSGQVFYFAALILCVLAFFVTLGFNFPYGIDFLVDIARVVVGLYAWFCLWMAVTGSNVELTALLAATKDINNALKCSAARS